ncbi:hypothetical protein Bca101_001723 [Brassica carinata]
MFYSLISSHSFSKKALTRSPVTNGNSTLKKFFKRPFHHPSLAKRIIARRHGSVKPKEATWVLDKSFDSPRVSLGSTSSVMKFVVASALKFKKGRLLPLKREERSEDIENFARLCEEGFGDVYQQSNNNSCSEPTLQMKLQPC